MAVHATSLNFHDLLVANGGIAADDGQVPMADAAGVVEAMGAGVSEFKPGDQVVSGFFPQWPDGLPFDDVGHFREGYLPGTTDNFVSNEVTVAGLSPPPPTASSR